MNLFVLVFFCESVGLHINLPFLKSKPLGRFRLNVPGNTTQKRTPKNMFRAYPRTAN